MSRLCRQFLSAADTRQKHVQSSCFHCRRWPFRSCSRPVRREATPQKKPRSTLKSRFQTHRRRTSLFPHLNKSLRRLAALHHTHSPSSVRWRRWCEEGDCLAYRYRLRWIRRHRSWIYSCRWPHRMPMSSCPMSRHPEWWKETCGGPPYHMCTARDTSRPIRPRHDRTDRSYGRRHCRAHPLSLCGSRACRRSRTRLSHRFRSLRCARQ